MRCYRRLLNISYKDHVTNEEVRNRIQNATGVHDDLLTMVKKRKLRWYGHISRSSGMAKTILQGIVKGARRRGRQKKRWEDKIKKWTGMGFGDSLRAAEDREGWKGIVATSSMVPRRFPRLRDWDEMRWETRPGTGTPTPLVFCILSCYYTSSMIMQSLIKIKHKVHEEGSVRFFQNLDLGKASTVDKWYLAIYLGLILSISMCVNIYQNDSIVQA